MANYVVNINHQRSLPRSNHKECNALFLVHTQVDINYLQFLNGPQRETWALYNAVWTVTSHLSAETVKSEQYWDRRFK